MGLLPTTTLVRSALIMEIGQLAPKQQSIITSQILMFIIRGLKISRKGKQKGENHYLIGKDAPPKILTQIVYFFWDNSSVLAPN